MRLDRNINKDSGGKYALVKMRRVRELFAADLRETEKGEIHTALEVLKKHGILQFGNESPEQQFFVIKHKDCFAARALEGYIRGIEFEIYYQEEYGGAERSCQVASLQEYAADMRNELTLAKKASHCLPI